MTLFRELLTDAKQRGYAIPAINVQSAESMEAVFAAAHACKSPVIVALAHSHAGLTYNYTHISTIAALFQDARKRYQNQVTACLHVDHGRTFEFIQDAIQLGFHSVMMDASEQAFTDNVATVTKVVEFAHAQGVDVEAELGHVGKGEAYDTQFAIENTFTSPGDAQAFAEATKVDALAVAFGTKHGVYKSTPKFDLERLREIRDLTDIPLVMHGTSGLSDDDIRQAIQSGIAKVNVFTEIAEAAKQAFIEVSSRPKTRFPDAMVVARTAFQQRVEHYMSVCGSHGRA